MASGRYYRMVAYYLSVGKLDHQNGVRAIISYCHILPKCVHVRYQNGVRAMISYGRLLPKCEHDRSPEKCQGDDIV